MNNDEIAGGPVLQSPHQIDFLNKVDISPKDTIWTQLDSLCVGLQRVWGRAADKGAGKDQKHTRGGELELENNAVFSQNI